MIRSYLTAICLVLVTIASAQAPGKKLQETAKGMMMQGDLENAVALLETAMRQAPGDIEIQKDLSYASYLKRDFAKAIQIGVPLSERADADEQVFQILGLSYKAIAAYKDGAKLYKNALKKFPQSAVLYNEYGELLAMDNSVSDAIQQWEKGINADPNFSSNYYNACIYYTKTANWLRVVLYGEVFVNMESFTERTGEVKKALVNAWQKVLIPTIASQAIKETKNGFEKAILTIMERLSGQYPAGFQVENATTIRTAFLKDWMAAQAATYPYQLFNIQQYFQEQGIFEAYNQWLFAEAINATAYRSWQESHAKEADAFTAYQKGRIFKLPAGQNYLSK